MTQWLRKVTVQYGQDIAGSALGPTGGWELTSESDMDLRIAFRFNRTNTNRADTGIIRIYNLPPEFRDAIFSGVQEAKDDREAILNGPKFKNNIEGRNQELRILSQANLVRIFAGYRDETKLIFQGDITDLKERLLSSDVDIITELTLGDAIIPLKFGYLQQSFGAGSTLADILGSIVAAAGVPASVQALDFLATFNPGVAQATVKNGVIILGGIQYNVDEIVAAFGVQWFVRDGESYFMARGTVLDDFSLQLQEGDNVLRPVGKLDGNDIQFTMLIDGDMLPGRGFRIFDLDQNPTSTFGYRADAVDYRGDTHARPWYCSVRGRRIDLATLPPPFFGLTGEQAVELAGPDT